MNLILCGLQASGKTTIGKQLSKLLYYSFVDTDQLIESAYTAQTGKLLCCREIYAKEGSAYFRAVEQEQISHLTPYPKKVISLGGGSLEIAKNVSHVKQLGRLIYLQAPLCVLWKRIMPHTIPSYLNPKDPEKSFYTMAQQRIAIYEQVADLIIPTEDLDIQQILLLCKKQAEYCPGKRI